MTAWRPQQLDVWTVEVVLLGVRVSFNCTLSSSKRRAPLIMLHRAG